MKQNENQEKNRRNVIMHGKRPFFFFGRKIFTPTSEKPLALVHKRRKELCFFLNYEIPIYTIQIIPSAYLERRETERLHSNGKVSIYG